MKHPKHSRGHVPFVVFVLLFVCLALILPESISLPSIEAHQQKTQAQPTSALTPTPDQQFHSHTLPPPSQKLLGHAVPLLKDSKPMGPTPKTTQLDLSVLLKLRNQNVLDKLLQSQSDPASPQYHHYLTPTEFTNQFGATTDTIHQVTDYLKSQNMLVTAISPNHLLINAKATVATSERAFGITLNNYKLHNRVVYAPTSNPAIPKVLASSIQNITGLNNVGQYRPRHVVNIHQHKQHHVGAGPSGGYTPAELRTAYNVDPLLKEGSDGTGQTIAFIEFDGYNPADINTYLQEYNLGKPKYSNVLIDGAGTAPGRDSLEVTLDMETASALAPGAMQKVYIGPNTDVGINDIYNRIVTDNVAKVVSISWGECELAAAPARLEELNAILKQGAAQGQAFFAASGDAGAYDCNDNNLAVDSPAGDPYVVSVGGTTLQTGGGGVYASETAWSNPNETKDNLHGSGSGGGKSIYHLRSDYQHGINLSDTHRQVPDVSANADPATGYSIYCTATGNPSWMAVGGTSAAAPLWAGIATDINQHLLHLHHPPLGNATSSLYQLYNFPQVYIPYQDITSGTNLYYPATTGYDMATGIGTPNAWNIARDLESPAGVLTELVDNTSFEDGVSPWQERSRGGYELIDTTNPHTGKRSAYLCGYNSCLDTVSQVIALPSTIRKDSLSYWVYIGQNDITPNCQDNLVISLRTEKGDPIAVVQKLCNTDANGWTQYTFDVTPELIPYGGKKIQIAFTASGISAERANFLAIVDDVSLNDLNTAPGIATQLLMNAGFENGAAAWKEQSRDGYELIAHANTYLGQFSAYFCGYSHCQDTLFQTVALPDTTRKVSLSYWVYIGRNDPDTTCQDNFTVTIRTEQGQIIDTVQKLCSTDAQGWTQYTFDVTPALMPYAGKKIQVAFTAAGITAERAKFFVNLDEVALFVTHN